MKALSLWQPWASLVAFEEKKIETRCWNTKYRGELAIASTKKEPQSWLGASRFGSEFVQVFNLVSEKHEWGEGYWPKSPHYVGLGAVLCIVRLVAIEPTEAVRDDISRQEYLFGNYEDGRFAWFLEMVHRFDKPIPAKGMQGLWTWEIAASTEPPRSGMG